MPVVLLVITIGFALASVGSLAAISSIRNSGRDMSDKGALGIAEAGAQQALLRQNKVLTTPANSSARCLGLSATNSLIPTYAGSDGWCAQQSGSVNGGTYRYQVRPDVVDESTGQRTVQIVSEGTLNGETRRIAVDAAAATGTPVFGGGQVVGLNKLFFGGNAKVTGAMKTNADLTVGGSATCSGAATVGVGKRVVPSNTVCGSTVTQTTTTLGPVDMGDVAVNNSNSRLSDGSDTKVKPNQISWNPTAKTLDLGSQSTLTLGGTNYLLCRLTMTGQSQLIVAQGAKVRIYFDTPENCGQPSGYRQIDTSGGARLSVTSGNPDDLAFLMAGSDTRTTVAYFGGNSGTQNYMTLYAPKTNIYMQGNSVYRGAIAGKEVDAQGSVQIFGSSSSLTFMAAVELAYKRTRFVECRGAMPTLNPGTGC